MKTAISSLFAAFLLSCSWAHAADSGEVSTASPPIPSAGPAERRLALGFNVDFLPVVMSAASKEFGMAGQVWVGIDHLRLRMVGARTFMPKFMLSEGFEKQDTTVLAFLVDYCFGDHFDSWWIGTGFELWFNEISHEGTRDTAAWTSGVWTLGGGYIWRFWRNVFLDPWIAMHVPLNNKEVTIGEWSYTPWPVSAEISLKIGVFFDL